MLLPHFPPQELKTALHVAAPQHEAASPITEPMLGTARSGRESRAPMADGCDGPFRLWCCGVAVLQCWMVKSGVAWSGVGVAREAGARAVTLVRSRRRSSEPRPPHLIPAADDISMPR